MKKLIPLIVILSLILSLIKGFFITMVVIWIVIYIMWQIFILHIEEECSSCKQWVPRGNKIGGFCRIRRFHSSCDTWCGNHDLSVKLLLIHLFYKIKYKRALKKNKGE